MDPFKPLIIFTSLKEAMLYAQATGDNNWMVVGGTIKSNKENVKSNKEKEMKNILIKFENKLLINYTLDKLTKALCLTDNTNPDTRFESDRRFVLITGKTILKTVNVGTDANRKTFVITSAANADIIIEEVIKEYNKVETESFTIGGAYNGNTIPVIVYPDKVSFNNEYMGLGEFIDFRNTLLTNLGGYNIGGTNVILFTHATTGTKVYVQQEEFRPIMGAVIARLNG